VDGTPFTEPANSVYGLEADCPAGKIAISGGWNINYETTTGTIEVVRSRAGTNSNTGTSIWVVTVSNFSDATPQIQVFTCCAYVS
jgi:hypothetical protein